MRRSGKSQLRNITRSRTLRADEAFRTQPRAWGGLVRRSWVGWWCPPRSPTRARRGGPSFGGCAN